MEEEQARAGWRPMREADLQAVVAIAARVHPDYPERDAVFTERLHLCPPGCFALEGGGRLAGYAVSHPTISFDPPALDTLIGALPARPDTWYIHDVALLPETRGAGAGGAIVRTLSSMAAMAGLRTLSLIAVSGSAPFWRRNGFAFQDDPALAEKLASYGSDARFMVRALPESELADLPARHPNSPPTVRLPG